MNKTDAPQSTTPQAPQKLPPLTLFQKIWYSLVAILIVAGIVWFVIDKAGDNDRQDNLRKNGTTAVGTANGDVYTFQQRSRRGGSSEAYKVKYEYSYPDKNRDNRLTQTEATGEKIYETKAEAEAQKGKTTTVYYDPNDASKGSFAADDE